MFEERRISVNEFQENPEETADLAASGHRTVITENGRAVAAVVSSGDLQVLQQQKEIDRPEILHGALQRLRKFPLN